MLDFIIIQTWWDVPLKPFGLHSTTPTHWLQDLPRFSLRGLWKIECHSEFCIGKSINHYQSNQIFTNLIDSVRFHHAEEKQYVLDFGWLLSCSVSDGSLSDTNITELQLLNFKSTKIPPDETRHRYKKTFPPRVQTRNRPCLNRLNPVILPVLLVHYLLVMSWCVLSCIVNDK